MKLKIFISGNDPRMVNFLKDRAKNDVFVPYVVIHPYFNTTPNGSLDMTKVKTFFTVEIDDDLNATIEKTRIS